MKYFSKKICLITPTLKRGGMERVLSLIANYADDKGIKVTIICLIQNKVDYPVNDKVKIISPLTLYKGGVLDKIRIIKYLIQTLRKESPDAVLGFSEVFNPLSILAAKLSGVRVYISDRSSPKVKLPFQTQFLRKILYPLAKGIISQTEYAKKVAISKKYNNNIEVISNPLRNFNDAYEKQKKNVIISMGRLIPSKNFSELFDIFVSADKKQEWQLYILGEGAEREFLERKIQDLGLQKRVKLVGEVEDVDYYFSLGKIFAFTSLSEGFPNALSEAMAFPLACIAYDCYSGPSDIIDDGANGFLIPLRNQELYIQKLSELMNSETLQNQFTSAYLNYRKKQSQDIICQKYIDFIL